MLTIFLQEVSRSNAEADYNNYTCFDQGVDSGVINFSQDTWGKRYEVCKAPNGQW